MKTEDQIFVLKALSQLEKGDMSVEKFCAKYEEYVNFEFDSVQASKEDINAIRKLFAVVAWYSPFEIERLSYKGFKNEAGDRECPVFCV